MTLRKNYAGKKKGGWDPVDLLLRRIHVTRLGCWETGLKPSNSGYVPTVDNRPGAAKKYSNAHVVMWQHFHGPVPSGMQLDHICRNRVCCNPQHLEPVTPKENQHRSPITSAGKTHCKRGHPLSGDNLYSHPGTGKRGCRECRAMVQRKVTS